ncbi:NAD-dependent epimerase/dehydratase family protein [Empedobacter falsenii]
MNISILGASGFIGQNLFRDLSDKYTVKTISLRENNWKGALIGTDIFINLIGKAHDHKGIATEQDFYFANVDLVKQVFEEFISSNAKLLIHISSLAALEEVESEFSLTEDVKPHPQSWYGKSKRAGEEYLLNRTLPQGKKLIILRPPMVHGPGDKGNLGLLYKLISKGIPYPLASFNNQRSFISIDNFNYFIQEIIKGQDKLASGIYHISDDEPIATNTIISIIKVVENKNVLNLNLPKSLVRLMAKIGDVVPIPLNSIRLKKMTSDLILSNQKIKEALGIDKLPLTAEEGIIKTIKSFKTGG